MEDTQKEKPQEECNAKLEELQKEKDEYLAGWQRAKADFLNYKKEETERVQGYLEYANEEFLYSLLPILDNLDRAEKQISEEEKDSKVVQGFLQIAKQIRDFLKSQGVEEMQGQGKFNPEIHEAIGEIVQEGRDPGEIAEVAEKGYMRKGRILRAAKVKVTK